ncbi:MAG: hypothetical protein U0175_31640 [Caldilineaceae bacterium]
MGQPLTFEAVIDFLRNYDNPSQHDTVEVARILAQIAGSSNFDPLRESLADWLLDHERDWLRAVARAANQRQDRAIARTISPELYQAQKSAIRGDSNPQVMDFAFWKFMVQRGFGAWEARSKFDRAYQRYRRHLDRLFTREDIDDPFAETKGPQWQQEGPGWCFERFGMSHTRLADGRVVYIAGEHEDSYDPDFFIYNDVIVIHPDLQITIYAYPTYVFPPTDFHSATLVDESIYIIGSLSYMGARTVTETPVYKLNCQNFQIERIETFGEKPGWIHRHCAEYNEQEQTIQISGGKLYVERDGSQQLEDNDKSYKLDLTTREWHREVELP